MVCPYYVDTGMFHGVRTRFSFLLPILQPETVVTKIVRAIERDKSRVTLPPFVRLVPALRLLPVPVMDAVAEALGINVSMDEFVGESPTERITRLRRQRGRRPWRRSHCEAATCVDRDSSRAIHDCARSASTSAGPHDVRGIDVGGVVHPLCVQAMLGAVGDDHEVAAGRGGEGFDRRAPSKVEIIHAERVFWMFEHTRGTSSARPITVDASAAMQNASPRRRP